ncbi:hypothetical protein C4D60_Mb11t00780 [Musa balbisiana]|uniref:Uncharacterized protein n=1 Tax=Musa balbisiana TaxID=52838 RepID=A0A4V4H577_MUSBA|nr:hypothetical protein C4D60_Mb11t00780 [Musa balbisiana]
MPLLFFGGGRSAISRERAASIPTLSCTLSGGAFVFMCHSSALGEIYARFLQTLLQINASSSQLHSVESVQHMTVKSK